MKVYAALVLVFVFLGSLLKVQLVWSMADMFNGLMVIPNCIGLLAMSGMVAKLYRDYRQNPLAARAGAAQH